MPGWPGRQGADALVVSLLEGSKPAFGDCNLEDRPDSLAYLLALEGVARPVKPEDRSDHGFLLAIAQPEPTVSVG
jgi:hypothetical protein